MFKKHVQVKNEQKSFLTTFLFLLLLLLQYLSLNISYGVLSKCEFCLKMALPSGMGV